LPAHTRQALTSLLEPLGNWQDARTIGGRIYELVTGAAYFVWEHDQGRHGRPQVLCPLCWLNKIAPAPWRPVVLVRPSRRNRPDWHASWVSPLAALTASP
jgi:hypothetical protein